MKVVNGFDFYSLNFDENGALAAGNEFDSFKQAAAAATDAVLIAHGFRNDVNDATTLYTNFLSTFRGHLTAKPEFQEVAGRKFIVGGVLLAVETVAGVFLILGWRLYAIDRG